MDIDESKKKAKATPKKAILEIASAKITSLRKTTYAPNQDNKKLIKTPTKTAL